MDLPYYKSEKCFRNYEPVIYKALQHFPNAVSFTSEGRSVKTDEARCRDAITSWLDSRWQTLFDVDAAKMNSLRVWIDEGKVFVGPKEIKRKRSNSRPFAVNIAEVQQPVEPDLTELQLEDIISGLDEGKLQREFSFPFTEELELQVKTLIGDRLNVAYYIKENNIIIF